MLQRIEIEESPIMVEAAKEYMRYIGTGRDSEIASFLNTAIRRIEDSQNISLRPMTVRLSISTPNGYEPLYLQPITDVVSVVDATSGNEVSYNTYNDLSKIRVHTSHDVIVEYKTAPISNIDDYKIAAFALTSLMFDGLTEEAAYRQVFTTYLTSSLI